MAARKKKGRYSKKLVPKEFKDLWSKDFDDLEEPQRLKMVQSYLEITQKYELGQLTSKVPVPLFMEQRDKIQAFERKRREEGLQAKIAEEKEKARKLQQEQEVQEAVRKKREERQKKAQVVVDKWNNDSVVTLNLEERLRLENIQLRKDNLEANIVALKQKIEILDYKLDGVAEEFAKKYEFSLDDYDLDLLDGKFVRKAHVRFPQLELECSDED
jgi:hypothetical protein